MIDGRPHPVEITVNGWRRIGFAADLEPKWTEPVAITTPLIRSIKLGQHVREAIASYREGDEDLRTA